MKKILITGAGSYIGTSFEKWCSLYPNKYSINTIDMRGDSWREVSFSGYDTVFHVAGIAHVSAKRNMEQLYYKINRDLAIETAEKAKRDGAKQFIFMSSIIIYKDCEKKVIDKNTEPKPKLNNFYGISKLKAEENIIPLQDDIFNVVIIRPPMVYGKGCKGNYIKLSKISCKFPLFPDINNKRSMIHIDNLCEFIKLMIDNCENGIFFPQNKEYVNTSNMVKLIAKTRSKNITLIRIFNPIIKFFIGKIELFTKLFSDLVYEKELSIYKKNYWVKDFKESIEETEL